MPSIKVSLLMRLYKLLLVFCVLLPSLGFALDLPVDDAPHISLTSPMPSLITNGPITPSSSARYWLEQDYRQDMYDAAIQPSAHASWHKITLLGQFNDHMPREKVIVFNTHYLKHFRFYLFENNQLIASKQLGLLDNHALTEDQNTSHSRHYNSPHFHLELKNNQRLILLINKQNDGPSILPLDIYSLDEYDNVIRQQNMFWGGIIAVLLAMALYNVLVYAMHPNRAYIWYLVFHSTCFLYFGAMNGYGNLIWPSGMQQWLAQNIMTMNFALIFLTVNFANAFLEANKYAPWHYQYIRHFSVVSAIGFFACFIIPEYYIIPAFALLQLAGSVFGISMGYRAFKNGYFPALYFLISWVFTLLGGGIGMATVMDKLPANFFTLHGFLFGTIIELFMLSVALASRLKYMEKKLLAQSFLYPDVNAANFSYLKHQLPIHLPKLMEKHQNLAILVADMKGFRELVSLYGPNTLSEAYQHSTELMRRFIHKQSWAVPLPLPHNTPIYVVALPGEQILIFINTAPQNMPEVIEHMLKEAEKNIHIRDMVINIKYQLGYAYFEKDSEISEIFRKAQTALLTATHQRQKYLAYEVRQDFVMAQRLTLLHELQEAIEQDQLQIFIQPQVSIHNQKLSGGEILLRWRHPEKGMISPGKFIVLAEQSGLIFSITKIVIEKTCQWLKHLKAQYPSQFEHFKVSINLSALDMAEAKLLPFLMQCLARHDVSAHSILLEVTESAVMDNPDKFLETIRKLKEAGFSIAIDDFGTGYSSMMYLQNMQADEIKIDLAFIRNIHLNPTNQNIVKAIVQLAHSSRAHTVAEGVQSQEELNYLKDLNCHYAQGFYWSPAVPLSQFEEEFLVKTPIFD